MRVERMETRNPPTKARTMSLRQRQARALLHLIQNQARNLRRKFRRQGQSIEQSRLLAADQVTHHKVQKYLKAVVEGETLPFFKWRRR